MSRISRIGFAFAAVIAVIALVQHRRDNSQSGVSPRVAVTSAPENRESEVRDRDIDFYLTRLRQDPQSAIDRFALARLLFTRSRVTGSTADLDRAEALASESIKERTQRNYQAFELLASVHMSRHEFIKARDIAWRVNALDPGIPSHLALLGEIELELGDYESAASHFDSVNYDGRNFTVAARIARWYEITGRIDRARALLVRAIANVDRRDDLPRDQVAWFHYRLGDLELRAGNIGAADSAFSQGLVRNPDDFRILGGLARTALERREWKDAISYGERATETQLDPATLGTVSLAYAALGDSAQASSYARAMSVSALRQPGAIHRAWGLFLLDHGTPADRADVLARARKELHDRKDVYGHDLLAWALYRNGRIEEARREMRLALSQGTEDVMLASHAEAIGVGRSKGTVGLRCFSSFVTIVRMSKSKGTIAILTGGGDVPGLNPAIRAITIRALREGYRVVGIRRGWAGLVDYDRTHGADNSESVQDLTEAIVNRAGRTGGTFLHTSRTRPSHLPRARVPQHYSGYDKNTNDVTKDVIRNLEHIGVDVLIPIGGDDTLSYGKRLHDEGMHVVAIPKTMDNDVYGTDYCIGFSTCVTRTIELTHRLRTSAGSHERFLVIEVFGRYAGFTALLPTMAGAADRCLIPEHAADVERLTELMVFDHNRNPSRYSVCLVSEGASLKSHEGMSFESEETDMFGHRKLGGIGDKVAAALKEYSPKFNNGRRIDVVNQRLGYLVRSGDPDALDSIVPMAFGNLALDLIMKKTYGRLVSIHKGFYDSVPITSVTSEKKVVDVKKYYNTERLRPIYEFDGAPLFIMTSD